MKVAFNCNAPKKRAVITCCVETISICDQMRWWRESCVGNHNNFNDNLLLRRMHNVRKKKHHSQQWTLNFILLHVLLVHWLMCEGNLRGWTHSHTRTYQNIAQIFLTQLHHDGCDARTPFHFNSVSRRSMNRKISRSNNSRSFLLCLFKNTLFSALSTTTAFVYDSFFHSTTTEGWIFFFCAVKLNNKSASLNFFPDDDNDEVEWAET